MPVRAVAALALVLAGALLTGCGAQRTTVLTHHELRLHMNEFRIIPQSVSVPPGRLKIVAYNDGILTHNLVIERGRQTSAGGGTVVASLPTIQPRAIGGPIKVTLPAGTYTMMSTIMTQADLGMIATLVIR